MNIAKIDSVRVGFIVRVGSLAFVKSTLFCAYTHKASLPVGICFEVPSLKVEWMASIDIAVNWIACIGSVYGSCEVIIQAQAMYPLPKPGEIIVFRQRRDEFNKLILKNEILVFRSKNNVAS